MRAGIGVLAIVAALLASSCGDDDTGPPPETLVGMWNATSVDMVRMANPTDQVDLVSDLDATVTLELDASDEFTLTVTYAGEGPGGPPPWGTSSSVAGTWSATDVLTLTTSPTSEWQFEIDLNGDTLVLTEADTSFDFDGDGTVEDADLSFELTRALPNFEPSGAGSRLRSGVSPG